MQLYRELLKITREENIFLNEPMRNHTTFRIGGCADFYVTPESETEFVTLIRFCYQHGVCVNVIGHGSNLLVSDNGIRGVVISTGLLNRVTVNGNKIVAQCGTLLSKIASVALSNSLTGFEFASGIPGYIGGAVAMNAGAYGGEIKDVVTKTKYCDKYGNFFELNGEEHLFEYRHSFFTGKKDFFIVESVIDLAKGDSNEIFAKMRDLSVKRNEKQPLNYPSAGSTFKRPEGYFAAKLIDEAGLRGKNVNDACVSEKHCGFIVNKGNAKASDVVKLIKICQQTVRDKFGVDIEPEVKFLGEF